MMVSPKVLCSKCKHDVTIENVRYGKNGKDLVCLSCFDLPMEKPKPAVERDRFHCLRCNYKFSYRKYSNVAQRCPYCSSTSIALRDTITARSVLREVTLKPEPAFVR